MSPAQKLTDDEFDVDELDVEYEEGDYADYDGEQPRTGTILRGYFKKAWWTWSQNDDPMIKLLWIAADNEDELEEFNGLPIWDNITFTPSAAFRYKPWLAAVGLKLLDIKKKLFLAPDDENLGAPIEKISTWEPGADNDAAYCRVVTKRERYQGEWSVKAGKWLPYEPEEDEEEKPARSSRASRNSAKATGDGKASRSRRAEPEDEDEPEEEKSTRGSRSRGSARQAKSSSGSSAASKSSDARGRRRSSSDDEDEPPF